MIQINDNESFMKCIINRYYIISCFSFIYHSVINKICRHLILMLNDTII